MLKKQIDVPVPAGQLDVGLQLLKGMYQATPDLSDLSQEQLLDLLLLADRWDCTTAVQLIVEWLLACKCHVAAHHVCEGALHASFCTAAVPTPPG